MASQQQNDWSTTRAFAKHLLSRLDRLDDEHSWEAARFTELEADFYPGEQARAGGRRWNFSSVQGPKRVRKLSTRLAELKEQFVLIEGDPGSGKSVLLRKVARALCLEASEAVQPHFPIPLYLNLKLLERAKDESIDREMIRGFVLRQIKAVKNQDIERFIDTRFDIGMQRGDWLFLFDSFDEIPDVLNAEEASGIIDEYSTAIYHSPRT